VNAVGVARRQLSRVAEATEVLGGHVKLPSERGFSHVAGGDASAETLAASVGQSPGRNSGRRGTPAGERRAPGRLLSVPAAPERFRLFRPGGCGGIVGAARLPAADPTGARRHERYPWSGSLLATQGRQCASAQASSDPAGLGAGELGAQDLPAQTTHSRPRRGDAR